jgi:glucose/arabinose dehydrogenase
MQAVRRTGAARRATLAVAAAAALGVFGAAEARAQGADLIQRATGLTNPIGLANAGDASNRVFVVEQAGCIRFYRSGAIVGAPCGQAGTRFLDIRSRIVSGGERGLLGLAFHPDYETNGRFFVYYTSVANPNPPARANGDIVIARYTVTGDPDIADPNSEQILIVISHSQFSNHNGGQIAFGPDGFLYAAVGDGGSGGDPGENGQDTAEMLGKIHRIDVNNPNPPFYSIPAGNPFPSGGPGTCGPLFPGSSCDEIWAFGLRNPWRFSFDRQTGDLYIGDVGQGAWEEIDFQPAGAAGGRNYGWDVLEGGLAGSAPVPGGNCHENVPAGSCVAFINGGSTLPILEYPRNVGTTVIGGYVYRGPVQSAVWSGAYVFSDFGSGRLWRAFRDGGGNWQMVEMFTGLPFITSFGEDDRGNLFYVRSGSLFQIYPWSFMDVPPGMIFTPFIERLYAAGVTGGCTRDDYCPAAVTDRAQMATFVLRAEDRAFVPPPCGPSPRFADVDPASPFCPWIEELARRGVVTGCGNGRYCAGSSVTRGQMAAFALATLEGPGYAPPACSPLLDSNKGATPMFADVPASDPSCRWIEELARRGVVAGCGGGRYCPQAAVTRGEMAVILTETFGLR